MIWFMPLDIIRVSINKSLFIHKLSFGNTRHLLCCQHLFLSYIACPLLVAWLLKEKEEHGQGFIKKGLSCVEKPKTKGLSFVTSIHILKLLRAGHAAHCLCVTIMELFYISTCWGYEYDIVDLNSCYIASSSH